MEHSVTLIPSDGIRPEVTEATLAVLEASGARFRFERIAAESVVPEKYRTTLPDPGALAEPHDRTRDPGGEASQGDLCRAIVEHLG